MEYSGFSYSGYSSNDNSYFSEAQRYHVFLEALGIEEEELEGLNPDQVTAYIEGRLNDEKYKRTEEELWNDTVNVKLGAETYTIKAKTIDEIDRWTAKIEELFKKYSKEIGKYEYKDPAKPQTAETILAGMMIFITRTPKDLIDLMFAYCPELPEAEIKSTVNHIELLKAAKVVFKMNSPFFMECFTAVADLMPAGLVKKLI